MFHRFLRFAVTKCGAEQSWLPIEGDDLQDLIGLAETRKEDKVPVKPEQLFGLIDSLYEKPELRLAVTLVGLFGLRPAELKAMRVEDGKLKVGNVKRNRATAKAPNPIALPTHWRFQNSQVQQVRLWLSSAAGWSSCRSAS